MATTKTTIEKVNVLDPTQQAFMRNILSQLSPEILQKAFGQFFGPEYQQGIAGISQAAAPLDEEAIRQRFARTTAEPALQRFQEEFIPMLQERFTASGAGAGSQEQLGLRTGAERLSSELARQQEEAFTQERLMQLQAAGMLPGYLGAPLASMAPYAQIGLGTQTTQPIARQTTRESPFEKFLAGFGSSLGSGLSSLNPFSAISGLFGRKK